MHKPAARRRPRCSGPTRGWQSTLRRHARRGARPCSRWRGRRGPRCMRRRRSHFTTHRTRRSASLSSSRAACGPSRTPTRIDRSSGTGCAPSAVPSRPSSWCRRTTVGTPTAATSCVARTTRTARKYETRSLRLIPSTSRSTRTPTVRTRRSPAGSRAAPPVTQTPEYPRRTPGSRRTGSPRHSTSCAVWKSKFYGAFVLNRRVVSAHPTHWLISTQAQTASIQPIFAAWASAKGRTTLS